MILLKNILFLIALILLTSASLKSQNPDTSTSDTIEISPELKNMFEGVFNRQNEVDNESIQDTSQEKLESAIEIDGLVIDDTKTKAGRDFYEFFFSKWDPPSNASDYTIFIVEKPGIRRMTVIEVSINETQVFRNNLQPRLEVIESLAEYAAGRTYSYLLNYEEVKERLGSEDLQGSGIY